MICDGTNVYNAASGSTSSITSLTLGNGSTSVPSLKFVGDANTGLFLPSSGQLGIVVSNVQQAYFSSSGLNVTGVGAFTGAVSGTTGTFTSGIYAGAF